MLEDCVDYTEIYAEEMTEEGFQEVAKEHNMTTAQVKAMVNYNGDICFGGYEAFGVFEDLFSFFPEREKTVATLPSLTEALADAKARMQTCPSPPHEKE